MMKMRYMLMAASIGAALCLSASKGIAQPPDNGGGGRPDFRNMSPEERQAFVMNRAKETLEVTSDDDWNALKPLVQKVMDARRDVMAGGFGGFGFGRGGRRGGDNGGDQGAQRGGGGGGMFGTPSPEREALQKAIESKAPKAEIKAALAKYLESRKAKQAVLEKAQDNLRKVLSSRQEAIAVLNGYL
jgi:hypothetical protein